MRLLASFAVILAVAASARARTQLPFGGENVALHPESSSSFIGSESFTTLSHPSLTEHRVRIKKSENWCDPSVRSYTGYIDNGPRHLFFYYFDSRRNPSEDDVVLWTNGGPGCSSSMGLFMELGPCTTQVDGNSTKRNPYSWTNNANMIFIDQPIGVGFSYSDSLDVQVGTTEQAALDLHAFLTIFFATFSEFKGRPLHLSGESYGGRYLPVFASEIIYQNGLLAKLKDSDLVPLNLKTVLIGNGLTDVVSMTTSYYDQACSSTNGLGRPILDIKSCIAMQQVVTRCDKWLQKVCRDSLSQPECQIARDYCDSQFQTPLVNGGINPYDISKPCTTLSEDLCYPETSVIKNYLDQPWVRQKLGVENSIGKFQSCSPSVSRGFSVANDVLAATFYHVTGLLENGVRVLFYVGEYDWICNYIGNYRMIQSLSWSGQESFVDTNLRNWTTTAKPSFNSSRDMALKGRSGQTKSFGPLTWLTIERAGHMVPLDKPAEALHMFNRWIAGEEM